MISCIRNIDIAVRHRIASRNHICIGWSKYLLEERNCQLVYSCDPGDLCPSVRQLKGLEHLKMKAMDAITYLSKQKQIIDQKQQEDENKGIPFQKINVWVSDMCLVDMGKQVDYLIIAKKQGLLRGNAFFVLTLKCTTGHSKHAFDEMTQNVIKDQMQSNLSIERLQTYHLFSNKKGERTVIGQVH